MGRFAGSKRICQNNGRKQVDGRVEAKQRWPDGFPRLAIRRGSPKMPELAMDCPVASRTGTADNLRSNLIFPERSACSTIWQTNHQVVLSCRISTTIGRPSFGNKTAPRQNLVERGKCSLRRCLGDEVRWASSSISETMPAKWRPASKRRSATQQAIRKARAGMPLGVLYYRVNQSVNPSMRIAH